ncbi:MAG: hypothetical protein COZ49_04120 [Candidatus Yonathbacteria bacterium CG_4_10_14_3_um_filter_47_65]|uniref:Bacterial type II secretion system protein E domain-containing protein n=2 Tax=Parcubacteria group TaxID=1794811 RepID=A0A2M8D5M1_9BACT|nr:MAG: hypothetical protein COX54_03790 [Candidatus Yonathbacteria bacterium CG23_combo_of_CG06-09_8_20_14_all_46_18]PIQ32276.1 MAG: hypothetical protein COW61_01960 [Candidatus Yonathbacteria bacterium CG17_big_fil_post_rev_8_21_14_2_50_46_19]PIX56075.1 MAG: hypothetical protein COZ49_04120 [Candidatus Yonathbacteria bacterium CG_4_10_14_3_um_filter_47_65]PIY57585.1 MAG: hypothetical protein COY99_02505 [Candidatus Yonathbacteria bacterium CG_4_10_14_0_8_um_filter_47_645]PJB81872.1 MAG: hypot
MPTFNESRQKKQLDELRRQEEEKLVEILSKKYGLPCIDVSMLAISNAALLTIKEQEARDLSVGPFALKGKILDIAILSPNDPGARAITKRLEEDGYRARLFMASHASLEKIWDRYKDLTLSQKTEAGVMDISGEYLEDITKKLNSVDAIKAEIEKTSASKDIHRISTIFAIILGGALATRASDIHFEPQEESIRLRYRLDGILQDIAAIDQKMHHLLISRIKLLSGLKLNVSGDTQDGRFSIKIKDIDIEIRTSVLPGPYGEGVVLRILNPDAISVPLEALGIEEKLLAELLREIGRPNGMILTTGPTGSGKTTTLYTFLKKTYNPGIKVITIEDPIEYHLTGITQTQVENKSNYTFLSGLRAALRQDPDIIMIGEIRDGETAKIAVNSALTGHLVLSTLHTNNAAGAIPRLIDLGINPKVIGSALNVAIAQRLIRKLCPSCKKEAMPNERETNILMNTIKDIKEKRPDVKYDELPLKIYKPTGCDKCNNAGYKGRVGIYEAIFMKGELVRIVMAGNPGENDVIQAAKNQGIYNMKEDGVVKVLEGVTSIEELERVVELN